MIPGENNQRNSEWGTFYKMASLDSPLYKIPGRKIKFVEERKVWGMIIPD